LIEAPAAGPADRQTIRLSGGTELSVLSTGDSSKPAVLLLHGFPSSARTFRHIFPTVSGCAHVIAPDLPGFGTSGVMHAPSFDAYGDAISEMLDRLSIGPLFIYLHDFGAPVGFHIALREPERVRGLIIQNANAHRTGQGAGWKATQSFWEKPDAENERAATAHLTLEGTRDQYIAGVPPDVAARIPPETWEEDWRVMNLPGRMDTQRALIWDYGNYVARFEAIAEYLRRYQPPAVMFWGRHDAFFDLAEVHSWMQALPRMEAHIFDGGHFLLETHAAVVAPLIAEFITTQAGSLQSDGM
jgi:pimeloyl-ACP methyl ester carboxylesterase